MSKIEGVELIRPYDANPGGACQFGFRTRSDQPPTFIDWPNYSPKHPMLAESDGNGHYQTKNMREILSPAMEPYIDPSQAGEIIMSHHHADHFAGKAVTIDEQPHNFSQPVHLHHNTEVIAAHANRQIEHFEQLLNFVYFQPFTIPDFGQVIPFPMTHSTVDNSGFLLELDNGLRILYGGDMRMGKRTKESVNWLKNQYLQGEKVDLMLVDCNGLGETPPTVSAHLQQMERHISQARQEQVPTAIYLRRGDYSAVTFWLRNQVFTGCKLYLDQRMRQVLEQIELPFEKEEYHSANLWTQIQSLKQNCTAIDWFDPDDEEQLQAILQHKISRRTSALPIFIYDDRNYQLPVQQQLISTGFYDQQKFDQERLLDHHARRAGMSGHDEKAYQLLTKNIEAQVQVPIHSPKRTQNWSRATQELKAKQSGSYNWQDLTSSKES